MISYINTGSANRTTGKINDMIGITTTTRTGPALINTQTIYKKYIENIYTTKSYIITTNIPNRDNYYFGVWFKNNINGECFINVDGNNIIKTTKNSNGTALFYDIVGSSEIVKFINGSSVLGSGWNFVCVRSGEYYVYDETGDRTTIIPTTKSFTGSLNSVHVSFSLSLLSTAFITENNPSDLFLDNFVRNGMRWETNGDYYFNSIETYHAGENFTYYKNGELDCLSVDEFLELSGDGTIKTEVKDLTVSMFNGLTTEQSLRANFLSEDSLFFVKDGNDTYCFYGSYEDTTSYVKDSTKPILYANLSSCGLEQYIEIMGNNTRQSKVDYFNNNFNALKSITASGIYEAIPDTTSLYIPGIYGTQKRIDGDLITGLSLTCNKIFLSPKEI